jgi:ATP/maltotriose-dependent transcriptional regulator MalT
LEGISEIKADLENIREAWRWAADHTRIEEIHKSVGALLYFYQYRSRYYEGVVAYGVAINNLRKLGSDETKDHTLAELLNAQGWLFLRLGQLDQAKAVQEESLAIYQNLGAHLPLRMGSDPRTALGVIANVLGEYSAAIDFGHQAYKANIENENKWNMMFALYVLTNASRSLGDVSAARTYAQEAYALTQDLDDRWFRAFILNDLGSTSYVLGEYDEAQNYFRASYAIRKDFDDPGGMAEALNHLAKIAVIREEYVEARQLFQESLDMYMKINDRGGVATTLDGLGEVARATGDYQAAGKHFSKAMQIAIERQFLRLAVSISINIGELWLETGQEEKSVELLFAVLHHPASGEETRKRAEKLLNRCQSILQPDLFEEAETRGQARASEEVLSLLLTDTVTLVQGIEDPPKILSNGHELIESLTSRELEVLHLISEGLTNKGIAEKLVITLGTVKWYNNQIYSKLNVSNRTQAVARARELSLLP